MKKDEKPSFGGLLKNAASGFLFMAPMMLGVIGLMGLVQTFITPDTMASAFGWSAFTDTLIGTFSGAISSGNPAVSYVAGGELLEKGTSLYAVTAFILSWVTLGFVQLPAETSALGFRFMLCRNLFSLLATIVIAMATVATMEFLR